MSVTRVFIRRWRELWSSIFIVVTTTWWAILYRTPTNRFCYSIKSNCKLTMVIPHLRIRSLRSVIMPYTGQQCTVEVPDSQVYFWLASSLVVFEFRARFSAETCLSLVKNNHRTSAIIIILICMWKLGMRVSLCIRNSGAPVRCVHNK